MHPTLQLALRAARSVNEHYDYVLDRLDLARADRTLDELLFHCAKRVEQSIQRQLVRAHPDASFQGRCLSLQGSGDLRWVVDSLVGQSNLRLGYPCFALSIAIYQRDRLEHVVLINPATEQEFMGSRGRGATLNGRRIRVSQGWRIEEASLAIPLPPRAERQRLLPDYIHLLECLPSNRVLACGCTSLDICAVAAGQLDAGIFLGAQMSELAPALLLLKEAGGLVGDLSGAPQIEERGRLLVTHPKAFRQLINLVKNH